MMTYDSAVLPALQRPNSLPCKLSPLSAALASAVALLAMPAWAQSDEPAESATVLQEVRVTSERGSYTSSNVQVGTFRDQDPLDVPLTNNVVTREVLDAQGANTLYGALRNTAGVNHSQLNGATYDNIAIRGILVENRDNYRLNGSLPIINLVAIPLENKERVEVLKGSSSLYYGLVPPSGLVNFVTKRAGSKPVTSLATSVNNHGAVDVHADIGRRFGTDDSMGLRINAVAGKEEVGVKRYEGDRQLLSAAYDWRVSPAFVIKLDAEHYRKDVSEPALIATPTVNGRRAVPRVPDNRTNASAEWARYDAEATNVLLRADWSLNERWMLTLETGQAETKRDRDLAIFSFARNDPNSVNTGDGTVTVSHTRDGRWKNKMHRADLTGQLETGAIKHEVTLGASYNERDNYTGDSGSSPFGTQNLYAPRELPEPNPAPVPNRRGISTTIEDKGIYLFDRMTFSPQWQLLGGVRYINYGFKTITRTGERGDDQFEDVSPNVSLLYKPSEAVSLYASYLKGLEPNAYIPSFSGSTPVTNGGHAMPPSENRQKELGVKARLSPGSMLQAAVFELEKSSGLALVPDGTQLRGVVDGETRYRGLELAFSGDLSRNLSLQTSALFLDAEITQTNAAPERLHKRPENTPKHTFSLFSEYRVPQVPGWSVNGSAYYVGKRAINNTNDDFIGGYTTLGLGTRYKTQVAGTSVTLQANVDNLTDRDYWNSTGNNFLGAGLPRTVRFGAKFDF